MTSFLKLKICTWSTVLYILFSGNFHVHVGILRMSCATSLWYVSIYIWMLIIYFLRFIPNIVNLIQSIPKTLYISIHPLSTQMQENCNFRRILNNNEMRSHLPITAKKFEKHVSYKDGNTISQSLFNYDNMLSIVSHDSELPTCDCKDVFTNFVYRPHGHIHTGDLELIDSTD